DAALTARRGGGLELRRDQLAVDGKPVDEPAFDAAAHEPAPALRFLGVGLRAAGNRLRHTIDDHGRVVDGLVRRRHRFVVNDAAPAVYSRRSGDAAKFSAEEEHAALEGAVESIGVAAADRGDVGGPHVADVCGRELLDPIVRAKSEREAEVVALTLRD